MTSTNVTGSSDPDNNNLNDMEININPDSESQILREAKLSTVTFEDNILFNKRPKVELASDSQEVKAEVLLPSESQDETQTSTPNNSPSRKIKKQDVVQIFRPSGTTGVVTREQVIRIRKMHDKISDGVEFNFNYVTLLMIACIVAGLGLATDSSTTVISSMLLSPLMGPVIGMSYGFIIWDVPLIKKSVRNELVSIVICLFFGLIIGTSTFWTIMSESWPTMEMYNRGTRQSFLVGFPVAFFSGMGVALSVLDDQSSSLVGVAISASLLPPAVNAGILLVMAIAQDDKWNDVDFNPDHHFYTPCTVKEEAANFSNLAVMSLLLTVVNILFVSIGAILMFRIKEVLPVKKKVFWSDLKIARRIYQGRARDDAGGVFTTREADDIHNNANREEEDTM